MSKGTDRAQVRKKKEKKGPRYLQLSVTREWIAHNKWLFSRQCFYPSLGGCRSQRTPGGKVTTFGQLINSANKMGPSF